MRRLSVVEGGPLDRLQLRLGLMKLQRPLIVRRAVIFALIAWLPLLILSAFQGLLLTNVRIPFLYDPSAHIRLGRRGSEVQILSPRPIYSSSSAAF
jgi:hypothetical protein